MLHHPCILGDPQRKGGRIRIGGAHKWAYYITPAFSGIPNKGDKVKAKKSKKKQKEKFSPGVPDPAYSPAERTHWVLNPGPSSCRGIALPTRVWPISDIPLHGGGIHIWNNLVFIHYWVLLKKLGILSIDTWGENPFFHPLLSQAKFP